MSLKDVIMLAFEVSLFLTVFGFGLAATFEDALYVFHRPGLLVRSLLAMFVAMPIVVLALVHIFNAPRVVEIVLISLAISPIPPFLPRKLQKAGAKSAYVLGLLTTASLLSIVIVPVWMYLLGRFFDRPFVMPTSKVTGMILQAVVLPLVAGLVVRRILPNLADRIEKPVGKVAGILLGVVVLVLVGGSLPEMWKLIGGGTLAMMVAFTAIGLAAGHLFAEPSIENENVLALATASRHPGIAFTLASANFPDERFGATILLYLIVGAIACIPYMKWQAARASRAAIT